MKSTLSTVVGVLALGANAIMIPSTVSLDSIPNAANVGTTSLIDPYAQLVEIPCPGCMYAQPRPSGDGFIWTQGVETNLLLNVSVGANPSSLELNGVQFYPPLMTFASEPPIPSVVQVPASVGLAEVKSHPELYMANPLRLTSWSFHAGSASTINEEGHELLSVSLHLGALEMQDINVPDVSITALKDSEGKLVILRVDQTPRAESPMEKGKECQSWPLVCKWKAILAAKLEALKAKVKGHGCGGVKHKGRPHHGKPMIEAGEKSEDGKDEHDHKGMHEGAARPHHAHHGAHSHGWHKHHAHHKLHRILRAIGRVMLTVFVPILIGVAAGMVLYLTGYVLGATVGFVVTRLVGRRTSGYQAVALVEEEEQQPRSSVEKFEYKDEEQGEAPPEYVEVEGDKVQKE